MLPRTPELFGKLLGCRFPNQSTWQTSCLPCFSLAFPSELHYGFSSPKTLPVAFPLFPDFSIELASVADPGFNPTKSHPFPKPRVASGEPVPVRLSDRFPKQSLLANWA